MSVPLVGARVRDAVTGEDGDVTSVTDGRAEIRALSARSASEAMSADRHYRALYGAGWMDVWFSATVEFPSGTRRVEFGDVVVLDHARPPGYKG